MQIKQGLPYLYKNKIKSGIADFGVKNSDFWESTINILKKASKFQNIC